MPSRPKFALKGVRQTIRTFARLDTETEKMLVKLVREAGKKIKRAAAQRVPVDSGTLRRSISRRSAGRSRG